MSFYAWLHKALVQPWARIFSDDEQSRMGKLFETQAAHARRMDKAALSYDARHSAVNEHSVELLALGNLARAQGDIDRAVRLRRAAIDLIQGVRGKAELRAVMAEAHFELGRDYMAAGMLDRALSALSEARRRGYSPEAVHREYIRLYASSGDYAAAAMEASNAQQPKAEAYFLVRQAEEEAAQGRDASACRLLQRAATVYEGSPETWLAMACMRLAAGNPAIALAHTERGLHTPEPGARLILVHGLYAFLHGPLAPDIEPEAVNSFAEGMDLLLHDHCSSDAALCYYAGLFSRVAHNDDRAEHWYAKALILDPDFWAARLGMLTLAAQREPLPLLLSQQIEFFTRQGEKARRFVCPPCGLRRATIFSVCPRCHAWHSVAFRLRIT